MFSGGTEVAHKDGLALACHLELATTDCGIMVLYCLQETLRQQHGNGIEGPQDHINCVKMR